MDADVVEHGEKLMEQRLGDRRQSLVFSSKNCSSFWTSLSYDATVLADKPFSNDKWALKSSTNVALSGNSVIAVLKNTDSFINFADVPGESCCNKGKQFRRKNLDNPKTKRL